MTPRTSYQTKQKSLVKECLAAHVDKFLSVNEVAEFLSEDGSNVGHTTVYRTLETLVASGEATKVAGARGDAARYRRNSATTVAQGQLSCLQCGRAFSIDCSTWEHFSSHVLEHHGFFIDKSCTALYGLCDSCRCNSST